MTATEDGNSYKSLDHAMEILGSCVAPYTGEQAQKVAIALKQWRDKWAAVIDYPPMPRWFDDLRVAAASIAASPHKVWERQKSWEKFGGEFVRVDVETNVWEALRAAVERARKP
jgi:hypothetical protein